MLEQVVHYLVYRNVSIVGCATVAVFDNTTLEALVANHQAVRDTNELAIGKFDTRTFIAVIQQYIDTLFQALVIELFSQLPNGVGICVKVSACS